MVRTKQTARLSAAGLIPHRSNAMKAPRRQSNAAVASAAVDDSAGAVDDCADAGEGPADPHNGFRLAGTALAVFLEEASPSVHRPRVVAFATDIASHMVQSALVETEEFDPAIHQSVDDGVGRFYGRAITDVLPSVLVAPEFSRVVSTSPHASMCVVPYNDVDTSDLSGHTVFTTAPVPPDNLPLGMEFEEDTMFHVAINQTHPRGQNAGPFPLITIAYGASTTGFVDIDGVEVAPAFVPFVLTTLQQAQLLSAARGVYNAAVRSGPWNQLTPAIAGTEWRTGITDITVV